MASTDTIAALATAPAPAGIAVVRVSGPRAKKALRSVFRSKKSVLKRARELVFGHFVDFKTGEIIDKGLAAFMPGPNSYTGEDIVEFQLHGSLLLVQKILRSLYAFGITPAEPGEFTKRAFLNGKMDLTQAEAIGDLMASTSEVALRVATEQMKGRLSGVLNIIGEPLRDALAEIEATIDFPEEDIKPETINQTALNVSRFRETLEELVASYSYGAVLREGFRVLLCGVPNAGKSSLLNRLLGAPRAIVTSVPGTTRDVIEEQAVFQGYRFIFCDSAGITETDNEVEKIGVELAKDRLKWADLVLLVVDGSSASKEDEIKWREVLKLAKTNAPKVWLVANKIDLSSEVFARFANESSNVDRIFYLSAKTREGVEQLIAGLVDEIRTRIPDQAESSVIITSERHQECLKRAVSGLDRALDAIEGKMPLEFISAELRIALNALDEIIGKTFNEDILGRIFSKFCIGK